MEESFVGYILLEHDFYVHLAILMISQFTSELLTVFDQLLDFLFPFTAQCNADWSQWFHYHIIHHVMFLHIQVGSFRHQV